MDTTYYSQVTGESFVSTAIYPNRLQDKAKLETDTDLVECGSPSLFFYSTKGSLLAQGYVRIVYGDHGPYTEHVREQIVWDAFKCVRTSVGFYDKWIAKDGSNVLLYDQRKTVANLPNPPAGKLSFSGNRPEGYADYRIGRMYISPYDIRIRHSDKIEQ